MLSTGLEWLFKTEVRDTLVDVKQISSVEDQRAKQIMNESAVLVNGLCQLRLRSDIALLPFLIASDWQRKD